MNASLGFILFIAACTQLGGLVGGIVLVWREQLAYRLSSLLLSFAAGTLLGVAFLDVLPETARQAQRIENMFLSVLVGILLFFIVEKLLLWHHHATVEEEKADPEHAAAHHIDAPAVRGKHIQPLILFGDGLHNFLDGVSLAVTFSISWRLGLLTALAVFFHEVPHNISDFAVLLHTRMERRRVLFWNILLALPSPIGALLAALTISKVQALIVPLLGIAGGSFLYIALADLMPEIHHEERPRRILLQLAVLLFGVVIMWGLGKIFPGV